MTNLHNDFKRKPLPPGQRRCISCKKPYRVGSSPVTRACVDCYNNPKRARNGYITCTVCELVVNKKDASTNTTCSNECTNKIQRDKRNTLRGRLNLCLQKARARNECNIDIEWLLNQWNKQNGKCFYTGWDMTLLGETFLRPSIERIDSSKGYGKDNVVLCCKQANWAKNNYTLRDFLSMCRAVVKNMEKYDEQS